MTWAGFTYATPRNPARASKGAQIASIARMLGWEPMPWQQYVWDVATEVDEHGNFVYEKVFVTVPRQSGKTTLFGPVQIQRAYHLPGSKIYFTAQTGDDARTLMKALLERVDQSKLAGWGVDPKRSAAQTGMYVPVRVKKGDRVTTRKSEIWAFPPKPAKIHGKTPVLVGIDEIWTLDAATGKELVVGGIEAAQSTLRGRRQIWFLSTAGTAESTYMKNLVKIGRRSVTEPGSNPKFAYFEASLPDDADPYDPVAFAAFHPAVGYTQDVDDLMAKVDGRAPEEERVDHATWIRAYCNRWTEAKDPLIPDWDDLADPTIGARWSDIAVAWDVWADGENVAGAIVATWRDEHERPHTRVLHAAPGTQWMVELLVEIHRHGPAAFGADNGGSTRRITAEVRRRLVEAGADEDAVTTLNGIERGVADDVWLTAARDEKTLVQDGSKTLSNGAAHLVLKRTGEVSRFSRADSTGPVAGPIASAVALWLYDNKPAPYRPPVTRY